MEFPERNGLRIIRKPCLSLGERCDEVLLEPVGDVQHLDQGLRESVCPQNLGYLPIKKKNPKETEKKGEEPIVSHCARAAQREYVLASRCVRVDYSAQDGCGTTAVNASPPNPAVVMSPRSEQHPQHRKGLEGGDGGRGGREASAFPSLCKDLFCVYQVSHSIGAYHKKDRTISQPHSSEHGDALSNFG